MFWVRSSWSWMNRVFLPVFGRTQKRLHNFCWKDVCSQAVDESCGKYPGFLCVKVEWDCLNLFLTYKCSQLKPFATQNWTLYIAPDSWNQDSLYAMRIGVNTCVDVDLCCCWYLRVLQPRWYLPADSRLPNPKSIHRLTDKFERFDRKSLANRRVYIPFACRPKAKLLLHAA